MAGFVPAILLLICVSKYGVNVPYGDEWIMIPLLAKFHDHQLTFADLFHQHNEHRILLPKLVYLAFGAFTHWNLHAEMYFSVALCLGTSAGLYFLLRRTLPVSQSQLLLTWGTCNVLLFSPTQAENWLWGFQLQMFLPNFCMVMALLGLSSERRAVTRFGLAGFWTIIATYSFGNSLLLWPLLGVAMLVRRERASWMLAWVALAALVLASYFVGYVFAPKPHPVMGDWLDYPEYFLVFLGAVLSPDGPVLGPAVIGMVTLCLFGLIVLTAGTRRCAGLRTEAAGPWVAIGSYAVLSAGVAAMNRVHGGPEQAADSRYISVSQDLYIGVICILTLIRAGDATCSRLTSALRSAATPTIAVITALALTSYPSGIAHMRLLHRFNSSGLAALQFSRVMDTAKFAREHLMIHVRTTDQQPYTEMAERLGTFTTFRTNNLTDGEGRSQRTTLEFGATNQLRRLTAERFEISGWAFLPDRDVAAPVVLLAARSEGQWQVFDICDTNQRRLDIATELHNRSYIPTGWSAAVTRDKLPPSATVVSAWAYDPLTAKAYKLPPDLVLPQ